MAVVEGVPLMVGLVSTLLEKWSTRNQRGWVGADTEKRDHKGQEDVSKKPKGVVGAIWSVIKALYFHTQMLICLIYRPGAAAPDTATIAPANAQQKTIEEKLQSQETIKEGLGFELQLRETIDLEFQSKHQPAKEEELLPQQSPTEEGLHTAILQMFSLLTNLWNGKSLRKGKKAMKACFEQINLSNSSGRKHYGCTNWFSSVCDETSNILQPFKSLFSIHHGAVRFIDYSSLSKLDGMSIQFPIVGCTYQELLHKVIEDNSDLLNRSFCNYFKSAGLSIDLWPCMDASQFTCKAAKKFVRRLKIVTALLCFMGNELDEADCISFDQDLRNHYFAVCARRPIENLIKAADSISNLEWSAHHIYQALVLYEANADVLRALGNPRESVQIFLQMQSSFERVFNGIKCHIRKEVNRSPCDIRYVRHSVTEFLVESLKLLKNHSSIVSDIFKDSSKLSSLLSEVISCWAEELEKRSVPDTQGSNYVFVLNNLTHFVVEITSLLEELIPNECAEILQPLQSQINENISKYLEKCWGPVRDLVELNFGGEPCFSSVVAFTASFSNICDCQRTWVLQTQLKVKLRERIRGFIIPSYKAFLKELQKKTPHETFLEVLQKNFLCTGLFHQEAKYKTDLELAITVDGLFESEYRPNSVCN